MKQYGRWLLTCGDWVGLRSNEVDAKRCAHQVADQMNDVCRGFAGGELRFRVYPRTRTAEKAKG